MTMNAGIRDLAKENNLSYSKISEQCGISKGSISAYFRGGNLSRETIERIERGVRELTGRDPGKDVQDERGELARETVFTLEKGEPEETEFYTRGQQAAGEILHLTLEDREFSILTGPSGIGKTHTIRRFAEVNDDVLVIRMYEHQNYSDILNMMLEMMGIKQAQGKVSNYKKMTKVLQGIRKYRLLVVDEADMLARGSDESFLKRLSIFRQVYEAGVGVCLVGLELLRDKLVDCGETYIFSRIGYQHCLSAPTAREMSDFWTFIGGEDTPEVADVLRLAASRAGFRTLQKISRSAGRVGLRQALGLIFDK